MTNGEPFWSSSKKYSRVTMHQMPPTSSFSNFLTMLLLTSTPLTPRLPSSASYTSRFSLSVTVTLSMTLRLPRSRIVGLDLLGLVGPDVVLGQDFLDRPQPVLDHLLVVWRRSTFPAGTPGRRPARSPLP